MSLTSCIRSLGSALSAADKKAVVDATLRLRRTINDGDAAAIQAGESHLAMLRGQLDRSEQIDRAHPAAEGEAFESVGMTRTPGKERWQVTGRMDRAGLPNMPHQVFAEFKDGAYRVWQTAAPGQSSLEADSRTFQDLGKAEVYAKQLAGAMKPALENAAAPAVEDSQYDRAREQMTELALEHGFSRPRIVGDQESSIDGRFEREFPNGQRISMMVLTDHATRAPTFTMTRSGPGIYDTQALPTQESASALLTKWIDQAEGRTPVTVNLSEDKAKLLAQFPIGTHVKIASWERLGNDNGKFAGRTGEVVDGHFDGWMVKLDPTLRERATKKILVLSRDGLEAVDKASIKAPRTKAEIETERRETERTIFADLASTNLAGDALEAEIRTRAGDVAMTDDQVKKLAKAIAKKAADTAADREKAQHRNPTVLNAAMGQYMVESYPDAGQATQEQHTAFLAGFQHAMAGKTKSTLTGENLADAQKGYAAAQKWKNTEEGAAWFEGRPVNKLKNTGVDLRRHWEAMRAQMRENESDVKKAWRQIERATTRADLFAPFLAKPDATPGYKAYVEQIRNGTTPFKEWLQEEHTEWYGATTWRGQKSDSTNIDFILDGSRHPNFRTQVKDERTGRMRDTNDLDMEHKWERDEAWRAQWLRDAAQLYLSKVRDATAFLDDVHTAKDAAEAFMQLTVPPEKIEQLRAKMKEDSGYFARLQSAYDVTEKGREMLAMWSGKKTDFLSLVPTYRTTSDLIAKEATYEPPNKATPLTPPRLDRVERAGMPDQRRGENVTPQQFKDTFGFADVGFGTWVGAQQDQDHLNYSFDAFTDLANFLKIDPKNMGFGGRLHFTIGALGHGKFAAHFQRAHPSPTGGTVQVINVTNTKGDGTVGHEWIHALDANLEGEWRRVRSVLLQTLRHGQITAQQVEAEAQKFLFGGWFWNGDKKLSKTAAAVRAMAWITPGRMGSTAYHENANKLGKDYWGNDEEMIARAAEAWMLDKLGGTNTYLVNPGWAGDGTITKEKGYRGTPYPSGSERKLFAQAFDALAKSIKWEGGTPSVAFDDFRRALGEEFFDWMKRRDSLNDVTAMQRYRDELLEQKRTAAAAAEEAANAKANQAAEQLLAETTNEAPEDAPVLDAPGAEAVSGPLSDSDLEDLFDQAAAEIREERQEQPDVEPPPDASSTPPEIEQPAESRVNAQDKLAKERATARQIADYVRNGTPVVFSGSEWASSLGLPQIHDFPSDKTRHIGFGVFEFSGPEFEANWTAGGAMNREGPKDTSWTTVSVTRGEWKGYPKQKVLDALEAFANGGGERGQRDAQKVPEAHDKSAGQLLAEAAKLGVKGADQALIGLAKLFGGGKGRLNSFPAGFDEETYQAAKPHFQAALAAFQEAGRTLKDLFKMLIAQYGDGIKEYAIRFAKDQKLTAALGTHAPTAEASPSLLLARDIARHLDGGGAPISWRNLFEMADAHFGGTQAEGTYAVKDAYDALEMGVNLHLQRVNGEAFTPAVDQAGAAARLQVLARLMALLPTQSKRTEEQNAMQQFSTVPPLAYMAAWVGNPSAADTVLEPSAGLGGLAVFAKNAGARVVLNELSSRRAALLQEIFPTSPVFKENAEQLHNILPDDVQPTLVLMNPPFSNSISTNTRKDTMIGARHVEQALARLAPGGRLVAIVGEGMARGKPAFREWWAKIDEKFDVRAAIPMDGSGYAKYGTTFDNVILVIDKVAPTGRKPTTSEATQYSDLIPLLTEIRDDRPSARAPANERDSVERDDAERARDDALSAGERDAGAGAGADGAAVVGGGKSPGAGGRRGNSSTRGGERAGRPGDHVQAPGSTGVDADDDVGPGGPDARAAAPAVTDATEQKHTEAITASVFEPYHPQRLQIEGAKEHPGKLVQSAAMATVLPPKVDYTPNLPAKAITGGLLSIAQLESVVYAGQAHREILPNGDRKGYFIGDGTGVGKGREISGILLDNLRQGRKKHVWVSEKQRLIDDARRDFKGVSGDPDLIFNQNKTTAEGKIDAKDGIVFTTYSTLRSGANSQALNPKPLTDKQLNEHFKPGATVLVRPTPTAEPVPYPLQEIRAKEDRVYVDYNGVRRFVNSKHVVSIDGVEAWKMGKPKKKAGQSRMEQLVAWLGKDFDGVIAFDEAHNAGNAVAMKGERGFTDPSLQALSVVELQKQLPKARVVYVSATGATQVSNLSYATRLGLWGAGTPFADVNGFIDQMTSGGLATMELVARDMKQMGLYLARSLSYEGVTYSRLEHELTPAQRAIYDRLAQAWQVVLQNFNAALEKTGAEKDPRAKSAARSAFWSGQQRFFNQVITSMQMPSVVDDVERELNAGNAVVLQLVNTNEAAQERSLARRKDEEDDAPLEELDLTPRDQLLEMVRRSFPVFQYEQYRDENGKMQSRVVVDSNGKPVESKEAVAMREQLLKDLDSISVPDGPLEQIINYFGPDKVAEITGRGRRVVAGKWNKKDRGQAFIESRGGSATAADAAAFMQDKKPILIFSDAGGTGFSFQAALDAKNQRKRMHYLVQPGWRADKAVQGFGRTHRTNQASEPHYKLVATDVPAHKRFLSAIARRLDQLGALTKGQRDTANQGMFSEKDNLEGIYAQQAVRQFMDDLTIGRGAGVGIDPEALLAQMGLSDIVNPETGTINESKYPETRLFLNRLLSLELEVQAKVFDVFIRTMEQKIDLAVQRGEFDAGLQTIQALSAHVMRDEVVYTEPKSGAETRYVELELTQPTPIYSMPESSKHRRVKYLRNDRSGRVWAMTGTWESTNAKTGEKVSTAQLSGTGGFSSRPVTELQSGWKELSVDEARQLWEAENAKRPKTYTERAHLIVGALLPIWDRLQGAGYSRIQVVRTQTDDGRRYLGRQISSDDLKDVLKRLNVQSAAAKMAPAEVMAAVLRGGEAELANGWKLKRSMVSGDPRIELDGGYLAAPAIRELVGLGVIREQISWKDRLFIPVGRDGAAVLAEITKTRPVVDMTGGAPKKEDVAFARRQAAAPEGQAFGGARATMIRQAVEQMTATWGRKPRIHVLESLADAPADVREEMARQDGQNAAGSVAGFMLGDDVYLVADQLHSRDEIREVLYHEALGHYGLRSVFGEGLVPILQQLATMRPQLIAKKAKEYGLDLNNPDDRLLAAEEVLAELAQTRPEIGWVQRAIAYIRRALRAVGLVQGLSDNDILANYIIPARGFVERGRQGSAAPGMTPAGAFSRMPGYTFPAEESPLYTQRTAADAHAVSKAEADEALQKDATARRIMAKGIEIADGDLVGARLNINLFKSTGVAVQAIHRGNKGEGYTQNRGLWGGEVMGYEPVVTLKDAYFNVGQKARERIATGEGPKEPMASIDGRYVAGSTPNFDGVEFRFNPKREHLFRDGLGRVLRRADEVTITGHSAFARGNVEYYGPDDMPPRGGDSPSEGRMFQPGDNSGRPVFARTSTIGATRAYTPEQERAMKNVGFQVEQPTLKERAQALWKDAGKKLAQGIVDQFRPVKDLSEHAYSLLRLSKGASGAFETLLHGGKLKLSDGVYDFDGAGRGGVVDKLLMPLQGEHHDFFRWVAANRAERLATEGKENLFTAQDIADLKTLANGQLAFDYEIQNGARAGQTTRSRAEAYADSLVTFNGFNKNVMDLAEQSGLIDGASRHLWEHEFYVPFYRVSEDFEGGFRGANIKSGVVRQKAFEKLKGGKEKLNADLLDNTLLNWAHLLDAAAKNRAAKATLEAAQAAGIAIEAKEDVARQIGRATGNRQGVVWFVDQGLQRHFVVDDPYILEALTSLEYAGMRNPVMDAMGAFKHALTVGVTASPFFKIRNLIRDSVSAIAMGDLSANPAKNLAQGWKNTNPKSDAYFRLLAGGGTIHFGTMLEGSEGKRVQALVESGVDQATILDSADKVRTFYRRFIEPGITAYNELGNRGEAINRAALYEQLRAQGVNHADASLQARDLMDFSMQGTFTSIRFLTQVVPFFNARIQGLYKLGRAAKEDPARFGMVAGTAALVSLALLAGYGGDDDWKRREEWDRDNYWWFKFGGTAFRIPKPFEIGAMATLAERGAELMFDKEMTGDRFRRVVLKLASDQLSMNPIPQLIKPVVDVYANYDGFTDRPIETMAMQRLLPEYRFNDRTSMLARGTSTAMNAATGLIGAQALSPVQVDHLLQGYFSWLGSFIVGAGDAVFRPLTGQPRQAAPDYWKALTGGMVAELDGAPSRYVSQMYAQAKEIEQAYGTWRTLMKEGKVDEAAAFRADHQGELVKYHGLEKVKREESVLGQQIRQVERSDLDPEIKRNRIQQIRDRQDRLARGVSPGTAG